MIFILRYDPYLKLGKETILIYNFLFFNQIESKQAYFDNVSTRESANARMCSGHDRDYKDTFLDVDEPNSS